MSGSGDVRYLAIQLCGVLRPTRFDTLKETLNGSADDRKYSPFLYRYEGSNQQLACILRGRPRLFRLKRAARNKVALRIILLDRRFIYFCSSFHAA